MVMVMVTIHACDVCLRVYVCTYITEGDTDCGGGGGDDDDVLCVCVCMCAVHRRKVH